MGMMNKLLVILLSMLAVSLEAVMITNWGAQLPTAVPVGTDIILMQKGGVTYYFTPNQLAANIATNAIGGITNKIGNLNGLATNTTFYTAINIGTSNAVDVGSSLLPSRTNWSLNSVAKGTNAAAVFAINETPVLFTPSNNMYLGLLAGSGGVQSGEMNTALGRLALNSVTSGSYNSAGGSIALRVNTVGNNNTAFGYAALTSNLDGSQNTALGIQALYRNTSGNYNLAIGVEPLAFNSTGSYNTGVGAYDVLYNNTSGSYNSAFGWETMFSNTVGEANVALGVGALLNNQVGSYNTAVGYRAGTTVTGSNNLTIGYLAAVPVPSWTGQVSIVNSLYRTTNKWGIDISAPKARLHILNGVAGTTDASTPVTFGLLVSGSAAGNYIASEEGGVVTSMGVISGGDCGFIDVYGYWNATSRPLSLNPQGGSVGVGTIAPLDKLHVVGGIVQTNGGIWQTWSLGAPSAPATQGAVYWNDGTNICAVFRNAGGALSTNKLSMAAWP